GGMVPVGGAGAGVTGTGLTRTRTAVAFSPTRGTTWPPIRSLQSQKPTTLPGTHLTVRVPTGLPNGSATGKITVATSPGSGTSVLIPKTTMPWPVMPNWMQFGVDTELQIPGSIGPIPPMTVPEDRLSTRFARQSAPGIVQGRPGVACGVGDAMLGVGD